MNLDLLATEIVTRLEQTHEDRLNRVELVKGLILQEMSRTGLIAAFQNNVTLKFDSVKQLERALDWGKPTHYFDE